MSLGHCDHCCHCWMCARCSAWVQTIIQFIKCVIACNTCPFKHTGAHVLLAPVAWSIAEFATHMLQLMLTYMDCRKRLHIWVKDFCHYTFIMQNTSILLKLFVPSTYWCSQWWHFVMHYSEASLDLCMPFCFKKPHFTVDSWQLSWWFTPIHTDGWSLLQNKGWCHQVFSETLRVPVTGALH